MAKVTIDSEICKGCALCVSACPKKILELDTGKTNSKGYFPSRIVNQGECIACAFCATICPDAAIEVEK